jgi:membrane protein YdbS with pleckstrin-like domain
MVWLKRFIVFLVVAFFLFYLIAQPEAAANAVRAIFGALARVFRSIITFFQLAVGLINWLDPHVDRYILTTADEHKVVEVHKHWAVMVWPAVRVAAGVVIFVSAFAFQGSIYWILVFLGLVLGMQALWRILEEYRDRFVITNQRVFRVHGVLATARASVPLLRILDITVNKPVIGRWLNYGHFVFESAAQVQGLNKITFVKDIDQREDVLRMVMSGDMPQQISASAEDDGT